MSRANKLKDALLAARDSRQEITCRDHGAARSTRALLYYHRRNLVREFPELEQVSLSVEDSKIILESTSDPIVSISTALQ